MRRDLKEWDRDKVMTYLCDELATSSRGIGKVIEKGRGETGDFPSCSTIMKWKEGERGFSEGCARAKEAQAEFMADEILEIADDARNDWMEMEDKGNPGFALNGENIQRSRLRVESRKWLAAKLKPNRFGEKIQQEITGPDGGPQEHIVMDKAEYAKIRQEMLDKDDC